MYTPEKNQNEIIAENLQHAMKQSGMSQNQLAKKVGVSVTALNKWVRGITAPKNDNIDKICQVLNIQRSDLILEKNDESNKENPSYHTIPVLGQITLSNGLPTKDSFSGTFVIDSSVNAHYCLRVEGDSMKDAGINHGDMVFIRKPYGFKDGRIYAVLFDDNKTAVLRKIYKQKNGWLMIPCNYNLDPICVDELFIIGECVGLHRSI